MALVVGVAPVDDAVRADCRWLRLMVEIGSGAAVYMATVTLLHRERAVHFLSVVRSGFGDQESQRL